MNVKIFVALAALFMAASCFAAKKDGAIKEITPSARMSDRTKDKTRDPGLFGDYWWANRVLSRHNEIQKLKGKKVDLVMLGDSITHFWEWKHKKSWEKLTAGKTALNLGYGGDRTQQVVWRIAHGELDGYEAKCVVLMIGTNNNSSKSTKPENVATAIEKIIEMIRQKQPNAKIVLHPIFPRGANAQSKHASVRERNNRTNALIKEFAEKDGKITWVDFNDKLVDATGWVPKSIMPDELHPSEKGYEIWAEALKPVIGECK